MNIYIYETDQYFSEYLANSIKRIMDSMNINAYIHIFNSEDELFSANLSIADVLFISDILINVTGLEAITQLRQNTLHNFILIFMSSIPDYAPLCYPLNVDRYLLKFEIQNSLYETLIFITNKLGYTKEKLSLKFLSNNKNSAPPQNIFINSILYLQSEKHITNFYINTQYHAPPIYTWAKLDDIEALLPSETFIRIHKSFLANARHLLSIKNYSATLKNDITLPVSQNLFSSAKNKFKKYSENSNIPPYKTNKKTPLHN